MVTEVEVKARLRDHARIVARLHALGCVLSEPAMTVDVIYSRSGSIDPADDLYVRVRTGEAPTAILTVKKRLAPLAAIEHEITLAAGHDINGILQLLGLRPAVEVRKTRRRGRLGGDEVCIDEVDGLGSFIEVERMTSPEDDITSVQEELFTFLLSLGVQASDRITKGYDLLVSERETHSSR